MRRGQKKVRPKTLAGLLVCLGMLWLGLGSAEIGENGIRFDFSRFPDRMAAMVNGLLAGEEAPPAPLEGQVAVHVLDVGQGDSILIQTAEGAALIDASIQDCGPEIVRYLRAAGVEELDFAVATHPHADHIGGMAYVLEEIPTGKLLMPPVPAALTPTTRTYERMLDAAEAAGTVPIEALPGDSYDLGGGAQLRVLGPVGEADDLNDVSLVCKLVAGEQSFLFTGDMEQPAEEQLLLAGAHLQADVLKLGHHGSSTSTSPAFLQAVSPDYAVASLGADNDYGHPHRETLELLAEEGIPLYRTDLDGTVVFIADENGLTVQTAREGA